MFLYSGKGRWAKVVVISKVKSSAGFILGKGANPKILAQSQEAPSYQRAMQGAPQRHCEGFSVWRVVPEIKPP